MMCSLRTQNEVDETLVLIELILDEFEIISSGAMRRGRSKFEGRI